MEGVIIVLVALAVGFQSIERGKIGKYFTKISEKLWK